MRRKLRLCALVWGLTALLCVCLGAVQLASVPRQARYIDHIVNAGADPTLGTTTIPEDRMVGGEFVSHLPLVVIDTGGQEIVSYKQYNPETDAFEVPAGIDPYFSMTLSVYDSADHCNRLSDPAGLVTTGRIKVRGNSSSSAGRGASGRRRSTATTPCASTAAFSCTRCPATLSMTAAIPRR